jgi:1-acyl-sn-glycerol-3-phosphate acyltransferase
MFISWIWILGLMSLFGLKFNIINIIISTFIFGLGDDFSIFMTEGLMQEYSLKRKNIHSYKAAMLLSALTMIIGIGVLVFARHPAMKSLGAVTVLGMITVVILSYTISPFLFKWLTRKSGKMRETPLTFRNLVKSIYSFAFFLFGSIGLNILGFILFAYRKKSNLKTKMFYHKVLQKLAAFVIRNMPGVDTKVINEHKENFEKPSIIISNHQSHIDLMLMLMLTPRLIILTNEWVWNSPFYGQIVKYLDFYPVASGIEDSLELLEKKVKEGYSILIFPEGTRSVDSSIKRFHKGAFFLAEKFNIDILPIMIHGVGHRVTKGELVLKPGKMLVTLLQRVTPEDKTFGENYSKRAKAFRRMYRKKYVEIGDELFTADYFKHKLIDSYIFKGVKAEWYARLSLKVNNYYKAVIAKLPKTGNHLDLFCEKGIFPMTLALVNPNQNIIASDKNEQDILLAQNINSKPKNLEFLEDTKMTEKFDSISIINRLQNFDREKQKEIVEHATEKLENGGRLIISQNISKGWSYKILTKLKGIDIGIENSCVESVVDDVLQESENVDITEEDGIKIVVIRKNQR